VDARHKAGHDEKKTKAGSDLGLFLIVIEKRCSSGE
jgi:hypothetical protein